MQDLVGPFQFQVLAFELFETLSFHTRQPGAFALVTLGLPHPLAQGLRGTADLAGDRDDCRPLRFVLCLALAAIINNHIGAQSAKQVLSSILFAMDGDLASGGCT